MLHLNLTTLLTTDTVCLVTPSSLLDQNNLFFADIGELSCSDT